MTTPILIPCEGSGGPGHEIGGYVRMCAMCGGLADCPNGVLPEHDRDDIIARVQRGDFG